MTDYGLIKNELMLIMDIDENEAGKYDRYIENAAQSVSSSLIQSEYENDYRVVHLCAVKVYYQLVLMQKTDDSITSFKAGDVSYTKDSSFNMQARELLSLALQDCRGIVSDSGFAFEVM